jgi:cadmium resistance protein CadD (predicted permease)
MKNRKKSIFYTMLVLFSLIGNAWATDESFADQFLGSPLLILASVIVIDAVAFVYHKLRK